MVCQHFMKNDKEFSSILLFLISRDVYEILVYPRLSWSQVAFIGYI